ncbi:cell envelope integrity EipB family protein [Aurantimonas sp. MSK8Z-1]|uniref:EipB family protein n=1 Tax=Mangrovibrevibacter kandeliae TaxID=2968473 RepID=UPI00211774F5|nr:DUF1849 family protein [Aurantimonas sp. MSK8Z-1]MCW4114627.1 cell envelope integrity EipB family protein [Aurantimonas sp. MSK8Z-1]
MISRLRLLSLLIAAVTTPAGAMDLASHRAVYDLTLGEKSSEVVGVDGRIALELTAETCGFVKLDYRFVARFQQDDDLVLTDQRTVTRESAAGDAMTFDTTTLIDGSRQSEVSGHANTEAGSTQVHYDQPVPRDLSLPASYFPIQHTRFLIAAAEAGESIVEAKLFDGNDDADKHLSSTAIIGKLIDPSSTGAGAAPAGETNAGETGAAAASDDPRQALAGLRAWPVHESFYNSDSDPDGLPVFSTSYVLYENGVSDRLVLDYGTYVLKGDLARLSLLEPQPCP